MDNQSPTATDYRRGEERGAPTGSLAVVRQTPRGPVGKALRELLTEAAQTLREAGVLSPKVDAESLAAHAWGCEVAEIRRCAALGRFPDYHGKTTEREPFAIFGDLVAQRARRVPLQHLRGTAPFRYLELAVGPGVFIPRPETELVAQVAIAAARRAQNRATGQRATVVDLGTGSGAIALAVATEVPGTLVYGVELSQDALIWARRNNLAYGSPVRLIGGDARTLPGVLRDLGGQVDVVVSNPPYIPPFATPREPEVAKYDPPVALYGLGPDGLAVPRAFTQVARWLLRAGGTLVLEHGDNQGELMRRLVAQVRTASNEPAFEHIWIGRDLADRDRLVVATRGIA